MSCEHEVLIRLQVTFGRDDTQWVWKCVYCNRFFDVNEHKEKEQ